MAVLDQKAQQELRVRAADVAQNVADFLRERQKDVLIATILPADAQAYKKFLDTKTFELWVKKDTGIAREQLPLYVELSLTDSAGREIMKIKDGKVVGADGLLDISNPANTTYKSEDYFIKARELDKGEVYVSHVTGWYVTREEFEKGKRFEGIIRLATPVFDKRGFTGVLTLTLDARALSRFTDTVVPTEAGHVVESDAATGNYAYLVDNRGFVISHPADYHIVGLYKDGTQVPPITKGTWDEKMKKGEEVLNVNELGGVDQTLPEVAKDAAQGLSGVKTYQFEGHTKVVAYAPVPFYTRDYPKPAGFGWVAMAVDVEKFLEQAKEASGKVEKEAQAWLTTIVLIIFGAAVILFTIAVILSRGINRSIASEVPPEALKPKGYDDED
ncbi:MAG TPA: cache domain-containing protein [Deltaproteobacteria bacterium]|nr:cache domain-containing protein [Deltaproteobacteria bacterium]HPP79644.1 cache domain-containing protein [Deltaproteobacteria bacterium]